MPTQTKQYVEFLSPGTFMAESDRYEMAHDVNAAIAQARFITSRYGAKPYGFRFLVRESDGFEATTRVVSGTYFLGGRVRTIDDVRRDAKPDERILLSNMENNGYSRVVENTNSWKWTQPLGDNDVVLNVAL